MTKEQFEEQMEELLSSVPLPKRKKVESDVVFQLCRKDADFKNAFEQAYGIIYGKAEGLRQMRRLVKKQRQYNFDDSLT
ncbi:MAG TPA: hypothetical protein VMH87_10360 [Pseudomonadales bacterium]|nr:hypothetical protein [Pseudomonadales bacterium]